MFEYANPAYSSEIKIDIPNSLFLVADAFALKSMYKTIRIINMNGMSADRDPNWIYSAMKIPEKKGITNRSKGILSNMFFIWGMPKFNAKSI